MWQEEKSQTVKATNEFWNLLFEIFRKCIFNFEDLIILSLIVQVKILCRPVLKKFLADKNSEIIF